ncbi:7-deoxyloganetic acid glucosyltransferase-like [Iris pallida]|uniref:Glycosyltransferase n=1 Tax=Iris pallida TaxID=29817 RepID=A0AAX6ICH2_IRIPA|nr:7-deoxyloganetic acid glucosyltransferase-like [Iris pallida]
MEQAMIHVLLFPVPAQGHVRAMLKLADLLHASGFCVTFVNTERSHRRFLESSPPPERPRFRFRTIPDGLPDDDTWRRAAPAGLSADALTFLLFLELFESMRTRSREHYRELLVPADGGRDPDHWPPVACVLADSSIPLAFEVAEELKVPVMNVATNSACSIMAHLAIPELIKRGEIPFPEDADMDEPVRGVAGMESFLRRRDLPSSFREAKSLDDRHLQFRMTVNSNLVRGSALILNTEEHIDSLILPHIRHVCPVTYAPGPPHLLLKSMNCGGVDDTETSSANLFEVDRSCMAWLDSQPDKSVVYVSLGSITVISKETFLEFWHGLVGTGRPFLWVIRRGMVEGGMEVGEMIGDEADVDEAARQRGCFVGWAPQEEVLAHAAVGCFLTHCGWNSTLESMVAGVPMVGWPFFTDQHINSRFVSEVWTVGVDMKDLNGRSVVERMVREVMEGERAEEFRKNASEMALMVKRSSEEGGSSYTSFKNLIEHIKSLSSAGEGSINK